uniref:Receptor expression-enhancing protein n=1 Tax=Rhizochromulina marina TaxID=1034831 RepID=A0A7S2W428_9STRA|mmetsp:Transcript_13164/g.38214  ORF Transcript_13164/g.38214 Transcript_13164/m.38214 type:complete len:145 (+) Transcript_13164:91-525(+)
MQADLWQQYSAELQKYAVLAKAESKLGVKRKILVLILAGVLVLVVFCGVGISLACNLVGFLPAAYMTVQVMEKNGPELDREMWLTYWVLFGACTVVETFSSWVLYWIPFYYAFKVAFLIWCMHPSWRGAAFVYEQFFLRTAALR